MATIPHLITSNPQFENALAHVERASLLFSNPDPVLRNQGEAIFLEVRQDPAAVEFACFALSQAHDPYVLFQAFQAILDNLPNLPLANPSPSIPSLSILRDFILAVILARSALYSTKSIRTARSSSSDGNTWDDRRDQWPKYARSRAYQAFAAVEKRLIGLQVEAEYQQGGSLQEAIQMHTQYCINEIASLFTLPDQWPSEEEKFLLARSTFEVGIGVTNAFLDEIGTTYARLDSDGNNRGKARGVDFSGLLPLQHRWCKAIVQTYVLPSIFTSTLHAVYSTLPGQRHANNTFLFPLLVSLLVRLFGWDFVVEKPFTGLEGSVSVEEQTQLLKQDESRMDDGGDDDDDAKADEDGSRMDKPDFRPIPNTHSAFLSPDVISVLHLAYNHAIQLERERYSEASYCLVEIGRAILGVANYSLISQSEADRQSIGESKRSQMECIAAIVTQACIDPDSSEAKRSITFYGNSLLFVSQLFLSFLTSSSDKQALFNSIDLMRLVQSLTLLTESVYAFAFESSEVGFEKEELLQLGDDAINNILSSWRALLPYHHEGSSGEATEIVKRAVFGAVVRPYVQGRLQLLKAILDTEEVDSELGQETETDAEKYDEQLILLASLARDSDLTSCIRFLLEVCTPIVEALVHFYAAGDMSRATVSQRESEESEKLWEAAHWVTLIVGHVIADRSKGEVAVLAQQIDALDAEAQRGVYQLIQLLGFTLLQPFTIPSNRMQSPLVFETALWFNARWIPVYLLVNSTPSFTSFFAGQTGQEMLQQLLLQLQGAINVWGADADVVLQIAAVIKSFTLSQGTMETLLGMGSFKDIVRVITERLDVLPASTHGPLISSIVGCIYTSSPTQSPEVFFEYIKQAIESRLSRVIHQPHFANAEVSQRADTILNLLNALDMIEGLASSIQPKSARAVYDFISRFFDTFVGLVQLYSERTEVVTSIIRVYRTLTGSLDLGFGAESYMIVGLNSSVFSLLSCIKEGSLISTDMEAALEESIPFEGLSLVIELILDLMLACENDTANPRQWFQPISTEHTSDVCLQGFSRITSMLNKDTRSVARIRRRFANLTSKLWISFPHRIVGILVSSSNQEGFDLYKSCISALTISLRFVESNIIIDCFEAIRRLSMASEKVLNMATSLSPTLQLQIATSLDSILGTLLRGILIDPLATSLLDSHLLAARSLSLSLSSEKMGGEDSLKVKLDQFCHSTSLLAEHRSESIRGSTKLCHEEEVKKRHALSEVVLQLATLCLAGQRASIHSVQGREEESTFLKAARRTAWEGRAKIRAG